MPRAKPTTGDTEEVTRFWDKISLVAEISSRCRTAGSSAEAAMDVLGLVQRIVPFDSATLYLMDIDTKRLAERVTLGESVQVLGMVNLEKGAGISAWTAQNKKPVLFAERSRKSDFDPEQDFGTILSVPLLVEEDVIGVLNLGCYQDRALEEKHIKLMAIIADQFAVALERRAYEEQIEAKNRALESAAQQLREVQAKVVAAERAIALEQLSARINHEINNPLAVIIGNVQCLALALGDGDRKTWHRLQRIESAALRISEINRKLLQLDDLVAELDSSEVVAQATGRTRSEVTE